MKINDTGRFCDSCAKSVIDFSHKSDEQIKAYILDHKDEQICGRFYTKQVDRIRIELDERMLYSGIPFWQKFLAIVLVCFGQDVFGYDFCFAQTDSIPSKIEQLDSLATAQQDTLKPQVKLKLDTNMLPIEIQSIEMLTRTVGWTFLEPAVQECEVVFGDFIVEYEEPEVPSDFSLMNLIKTDTNPTRDTASSDTAVKRVNTKPEEPKPTKNPSEKENQVFIADLGNGRKRRITK